MKVILGLKEEGTRVDAWLAKAVEVSRRRAVEMLGAGSFTVNGAKVPPDRHLRVGDVVEGEATPDPATLLAPEKGKPVPIVFQDTHLLVVDKPAGLTVHPGSGRSGGTLVNLLLGMGVPLAAAGGALRPGVVHRIDKDTSGLLVLAKTDKAFWALSKMAREHEFEREYLALVAGVPSPKEGSIDAALGRDPRHREQFMVVASGGREALTHYTTVEAYRGAALVRLRLETGRTHQIRVHLAACGWPLLGDRTYDQPVRRGARPALGLPEPARQALHAAGLGFPHPVTGKPLAFKSPFPPDLEAIRKLLRAR